MNGWNGGLYENFMPGCFSVLAYTCCVFFAIWGQALAAKRNAFLWNNLEMLPRMFTSALLLKTWLIESFRPLHQEPADQQQCF